MVKVPVCSSGRQATPDALRCKPILCHLHKVPDRAIHYGAVWLKIIDEPPKKVLGHYWTDRESAGEMELTDQQRKKFQTFQSAQDHYRQLPPAT